MEWSCWSSPNLFKKWVTLFSFQQTGGTRFHTPTHTHKKKKIDKYCEIEDKHGQQGQQEQMKKSKNELSSGQREQAKIYIDKIVGPVPIFLKKNKKINKNEELGQPEQLKWRRK